MKVNNKDYRTVWMEGQSVCMIEQNLLPFQFKVYKATTCAKTCNAIRTMIVRGAGAIGATAGYAMAQAFIEAAASKGKTKEFQEFWEYIDEAKKDIEATRPTAQNLFHATNRVYSAAKLATSYQEAVDAAMIEAQKIADEDAEACRKIGEHGNGLIQKSDSSQGIQKMILSRIIGAQDKSDVKEFNILTHCNAGWLAFVDYGSALSPVYVAHRSGKKVFVYADETRPRSQGARLTAWELKNEGVPHIIVPDNAGAYLMSSGRIDMIIVGSDRIAANGDVANKIGTFEKAIVAREFGIPFYVAAPTSTIDLKCKSGKDIPIEQRSEDEVLYQTGPIVVGKKVSKEMKKVLVCSPGSKALNPAFDVTPAKYITGIITEKGIIRPNEKEIQKLFR